MALHEVNGAVSSDGVASPSIIHGSQASSKPRHRLTSRWFLERQLPEHVALSWLAKLHLCHFTRISQKINVGEDQLMVEGDTQTHRNSRRLLKFAFWDETHMHVLKLNECFCILNEITLLKRMFWTLILHRYLSHIVTEKRLKNCKWIVSSLVVWYAGTVICCHN